MNVKIYQVKKKDIKDFFNYLKLGHSSFFPWYSPKTEKYMLENQRGWSIENLYRKVDDGSCMLMAKIDKKIVGLLIANHHFGGVAFCTKLAVSKEFQRQGIGTKLIEGWAKIAKSQGVHALVLQVFAENKSIKFYESLGFKLIGLHEKFNFGKDYYVLQKNIAEPKEENFLK